MGKAQCETRDHIVMNKAKNSEIDEQSLKGRNVLLSVNNMTI